MNEKEIVLWTLAGIGVIALLWMAAQQTGDSGTVPEVQTDENVEGLGVQAGLRLNAGTPLDMSMHIHGWHPGYDPDPHATPVVQSKVRYPAIPGGNISTILHKGWAACIKGAPAGNDWRLNPPEAAVL